MRVSLIKSQYCWSKNSLGSEDSRLFSLRFLFLNFDAKNAFERIQIRHLHGCKQVAFLPTCLLQPLLSVYLFQTMNLAWQVKWENFALASTSLLPNICLQV